MLDARRVWLLCVSCAVLLVGCSSSDGPVATTVATSAAPTTTAPAGCEPAETTGSPPTVTATTTSTTTTPVVPTTTTPPAPLAAGDAGPAVTALQQQLSTLGYWLGEIDGEYGSSTGHAITAFQKVHGMARDGLASVEVQQRLATAEPPAPRSTTGRVIEIDLDRQVLLVVTDGAGDAVFDTATGASATPTPPGEYAIYREIDGYRHAPLGTLYRPKYFNGGIAIHGFTSVPPQPASHGCVRLTYPAMDQLWAADLAPLGTAVWVY